MLGNVELSPKSPTYRKKLKPCFDDGFPNDAVGIAMLAPNLFCYHSDIY